MDDFNTSYDGSGDQGGLHNPIRGNQDCCRKIALENEILKQQVCNQKTTIQILDERARRVKDEHETVVRGLIAEKDTLHRELEESIATVAEFEARGAVMGGLSRGRQARAVMPERSRSQRLSVQTIQRMQEDLDKYEQLLGGVGGKVDLVSERSNELMHKLTHLTQVVRDNTNAITVLQTTVDRLGGIQDGVGIDVCYRKPTTDSEMLSSDNHQVVVAVEYTDCAATVNCHYERHGEEDTGTIEDTNDTMQDMNDEDDGQKRAHTNSPVLI